MLKQCRAARRAEELEEFDRAEFFKEALNTRVSKLDTTEKEESTMSSGKASATQLDAKDVVDQINDNVADNLKTVIKHRERVINLVGLKELEAAGDPNPVHAMALFREQLLDPEHVEDYNLEYEF